MIPTICFAEVPRRGLTEILRSASPALRALAPVLTAGAVIGLAGCGAAPLFSTADGTANSTMISGLIRGGQQPVAGAAISLIAPGTGGYGSAGTVIVSTSTAGDGTFTLPRPYSCPANSGLVYILAKGGNAGGGSNSAIALSAVLGPCSGLTASTYVNIDEVTTVAAAYVLAPFATVGSGGVSIGTSATNLQGLTNAAGAAGNLANTSTGNAHVTGDLTGIVPPTAEINTLADILAGCVNQGASGVAAGTCASLFTAATPPGGSAPTDTFQAAVDIAQNPGNNTATLWGLDAAIVPFQPALTTAPADFSVALGYNGGAITVGGGSIGVAIDAAGDAWIATGYPGMGVGVLTEISPAGAYLSGATVAATTGYGSAALSNPIGLAIDQNGAVFVDNNGAGNLLKFNSGGTLLSTFTATSFDGPNGVAIDGSGDPWVSNFGGTSMTEMTAAGVEASHSPFAVGSGQVDVATSPTAVWVAGYGSSGDVSRVDLTSFSVLTVSTGASNAGLAIDHAKNAWVASTGNGAIYEITDSGSVSLPPGNFSTGSYAVPQSVAVDGLGNVFSGTYLYPFFVNSMGGLIEFSNAGALLSPGNGYAGSNVIPVLPEVPGGIAIDGSGNVWIAGTNNSTSLPNYVAEVIGIAAPVTTPLSVAVKNNTLGTRP